MKKTEVIIGISLVVLLLIFIFITIWSDYPIWVTEPFEGNANISTWSHGWNGPHYYPRCATFPGWVNFIVSCGLSLFAILNIIFFLKFVVEKKHDS